MKKAAILIMFITVFSKFVGFVRELVLSYYYGASDITDIYFISQMIPTVIFSIIIASLTNAYIPSFSKIKEKEGVLKSLEFTNNLINIAFLISTILLFFTFIFASNIVKIFALGFEGELLAKAVHFTRISIFTIYLTVLITIFTGYLQIYNNFFIPAFAGLPLTIVTILSIVLSYRYGELILAYGIIVAFLSQTILLMIFAYKKGFRYKINIILNDHNIKNFLFMVLPLFIGVAISQINIIVDKSVASTLAEGSISALNYAQKLTGLVHGLVVTSIATAMFPMISKMASEKNQISMKKMISESISAINILVIPASVGFVVFSEPIVIFLFGRGAFNQQAILMTSNALFYYAFGMVAIGLREILSRVFYSLHDTKTPILYTSIGVLLNIVLNLILPKIMGISGLALSSSISAFLIVILLFYSLRKKIGTFGLKSLFSSFLKIFLSSVIMGFFAYLTLKVLKSYINSSISLLISIFVGGIVYLISIYLMKVDEVSYIIGLVKNKANSKMERIE